MHETPLAFFHLDQPAADAGVIVGPVRFQGWAAGRNGRPLVDLRLRAEGSAHPAIYGFPRADLAAFFKLPGPFLPVVLRPPSPCRPANMRWYLKR